MYCTIKKEKKKTKEKPNEKKLRVALTEPIIRTLDTKLPHEFVLLMKTK